MAGKSLAIGIIILFLFCNISFTTLSDENIGNLGGKTLYVGGGGTGNYTRIQDAVDDASDGDTVFVYSGTYYENVVLNKNINFVGEDKTNTIIDGKGLGVVINISQAEYCNVNGFTILNSKSNAAGILVKTSNNNISNNIIKNNYFGIYVSYYGEYNSFYKNHIMSNDQYGVYVSKSNYNVIIENEIKDNNYGMRIKGSRYNKVIANNFYNNFFGIYFCCGSQNNIVHHCNFINNREYHARDYLNNDWDDGNQGNYWDDYKQKTQGANGLWLKGVWDTPYIDSESVQDNYPLIVPYKTSNIFLNYLYYLIDVI